MGQVFRATDSKLKRQVAIKTLSPSFAADHDRLARFQREAEVLAALNHPHIAGIYGLEERDGVFALVIELVEGEDLAERIARGAMPIDEALPIAKQIAAALEAAHEQGIIHRDLKPANIKVRSDGTVKVLDFGLARIVDAGGAGAAVKSGATENSPTMTSPAMTQAGMILGTAAYMAPEQARGRVVDKRADIWAFGVVLYEMLTGQRAFPGEDVTDTLAAVVRGEPDWTLLPPHLSPTLVTYLKRCLHKDPTQRIPDFAVIRLALDGAFETGAPQTTLPAVAAPRSVVARAMPAVAAVLLVALGIALWAPWRSEIPADRPLMRLDVDMGEGVSFGSMAGADTIISPDGTRIAYVSHRKLFTRGLDEVRAVELAGTDGAYAPFFSPDGEWLAFFTSGKLKKVPVAGGVVVDLCDAGRISTAGGSWGEDGNIIAALSAGAGLMRIPSTGGDPTPVTERPQGGSHRWPQVLPGGKAVVFTEATASSSAVEEFSIEAISLADQRRKTLVRGGTFGRYLPVSNGTGYLVYLSKGILFAVPFEPGTLELLGTPSPVLEDIADGRFGSAQFDVARNGTLVYRGDRQSGEDLVTVQWLDAAGKTEPLLVKPGRYRWPRLSPDGQRLAMMEGTDVVVYDPRRDTTTRVEGYPTTLGPIWSPDSRYILYQAQGIRYVRADGAGTPQQLMAETVSTDPFSFTPDGKRLAYSQRNPGQNDLSYDIWTISIDSAAAGLQAGKPERFLQSPADEFSPAFSPDGRWLAYLSNESGKYEVWVRAFPDKGGKWQISNEGGGNPVWSPNGRELFFRGEDNRIMAATYTATGDSFAPDKPRPWSEKQLADIAMAASILTFDLAPDGKRVAALMPVATPGQSHVTFLLNFGDELRRKMPVRK